VTRRDRRFDCRKGWVLVSRILVVDDEPDMRFLLRIILGQAGHEVNEAIHGAAALESVNSSPPELVVTDMMMPVMGGAELIGQLRSNPVTADIPVLAITGDPKVAGAADAVLSKPYHPNQVVLATNALLAKEVD